MAYTIPYTDFANKASIQIEDGILNQDTSLKIPGRNTVSYGSAIAENFLHLLENFAAPNSPANPIEGQLWYDSNANVELLKVFNGVNWIPAGGVKKAATEPEADKSLVGDLWVDTENQQLYLYTGSGYILVGPEYSEGLVTGIKPIIVTGTDDKDYNLLQIEIASKPAILISTSQVVPKAKIPGFSIVYPGINLNTANIAGAGFLKYYGTAEKAESLVVNGLSVAAGNFLRSDAPSDAYYPINVQNNSGINFGVNGELTVGVEDNTGIIQHNVSGSSIDFKVKNDNKLVPLVRFDSSLKVGINTTAPQAELDVYGDIQTSPTISDTSKGKIIVNNVTDSTSINSGSIVTYGGLGVAKNVNVGGDVAVVGSLTTRNVQPDISGTRNIGTEDTRYKNIYATTFVGSLIGNVSGTVSGLAGSAEKLASPTTFRITGDVAADDIIFDGSIGGTQKIFNTELQNTVVSNKIEVLEPNLQDEILVNRITGDTGLKKIQLQNVFTLIPRLPTGMIVPFAGLSPPENWLLCYGQEVEITEYPLLYNVILYTYKAQEFLAEGYFALPDLRGRFPLGRDNMGSLEGIGVVPGAVDLGAKDGAYQVQLQEQNLPDHKHDLKGDSGDQYYIIRDVAGTPNDNEAIVYDAPNGLGEGQALSNSGGLLSGQTTNTPFNIMNPYMTLNYIIYTGKNE